MRKLFGRRKDYSDKEYDEWYEGLEEDDEIDDENDEDDEEEIDEDDGEETDEDEDDVEEDEEEDDKDDEDGEDGEDDEIDEEADDEEEDGEDDEDDEEDEEEDGEEDEDDDEDSEDDEDEDEDSEDEDEDDEDEDEDDEIDDEEDDEDDGEDDEDDEETEEDRREYRRRRRIRNQIIAYSVVGIFVIALVAAGIFVGHRVSTSAQEKRQAEEIAQQLAEQEQAQQDIVIEAPPEIEEETPDEQLDEIVNSCISEMPLEDKVAGLFIITPEALTGVGTVTQAGEGTQAALNEYAVGGLIYFSKNIVDKEQLTAMLSNTGPKSKYPIFLAVDEEGGEVSRVANSDVEVIQVDDMATIGAGGDTTAAYEAGVTIGSYLKELGFNLDFAPVADVTSDNDVLGNRSFGSDAALVSDMVANVAEGLEGTGVSACMKHFPGIGSAEEDTHDGRAEITKTLDEMRASDFLPFEAGIEVGVDFIMVSHAVASGIDAEGKPSSLSESVITNVLRGELGYNGIVITDALNMGAVTEYYTSEEAAVMAIEAGADMLLMPEDFEAAYNAVLSAVQNGTISEERINESLRRIYRVKYADKLQ